MMNLLVTWNSYLFREYQLIVDLNNPGGYLHEAVAMADEFLEEGNCCYHLFVKEMVHSQCKQKSGDRYRSSPVHIMTMKISAEVQTRGFTGILQDNDRATVYGKTSFQ